MIRIKVDDKDLDVGNLKLSFKFINPLFTDKIFSDGYSFPFTLPISDNNLSLLVNGNRLDNNKIKRKVFVKIYYQNTYLFSGFMNIKTVNTSGFECFYNSRGLDLAKRLTDIKLRELVLFSKTVCASTDSGQQKQTKWETQLVAQSQIIANIRPFEQITHYFPPIHSPYAYDTDTTPTGTDTVTGFIKNHWWSQFINFYSDDEARYMVGNRVLTTVYATRPGWQTTISPCPSFVYVLEQVLAKIGYVLDKTQLLAMEEIKHLFIFSNNVADMIEPSGSYTYNVYGLGYDLADFLPNMASIELPKALKQLFQAIFIEQDGRIKVIAGKDVLNQNIEDWSAYTEYAYMKNFTDLFNLSFEWTESTGDKYFKLYPEQFDPYKIDNDQDELITIKPDKVRPLATRVNPRGNVWGTWTSGAHDATSIGSTSGPLLFTFQNPTSLGHNTQVKSAASEESPTDIAESLLLGVWRGESFFPSNYPSAVNQSVDDNGVVYGDRSILWPGDDGLVENYQADFFNFINGASEFVKNLYLPIHKIAKLATFQQMKFGFKHPMGNMNGIIKEFEFELSNEGISPLKATFLQHENG